MSTHAKYSPSKLPRIIKCPGSVGLTKKLKEQGLIPSKETSSPAAEEGTMLHAVMEEALTKKYLEVSPGQIDKYELTAEHIEACNECLDYIQVLKMNIPDDTEYKEFIETKVTLGGTYLDDRCSELADVYGTVDYMLMYNQKLIVLDWKFGKGIEVWPDSAQTKAYTTAALSVYAQWTDPLVASRETDITIIIGQPRISGEHFKELEVTEEELILWLINILIPALRSINSADPIFSPGDKACMWCPVKHMPHACTARLDMVKEVTSSAFKDFAIDPHKESLDEALELLKKLPVVEKFFKDVLLYTTNRLKQGEKVPGYKMVRGRSTRVFKKLNDKKMPAEFLSWAEDELNRDSADFMITKPMSAPQAEKFLTKRVLKSHPAFYDFIHKPEGKLTLATEDDPREAVDFETTSDAFLSCVKKD